MNFEEYQKAAVRTAAGTSGALGLAVLGLGLTGEAGEVAELIKKHVGHGHDLLQDQIRKELGDVLWYLATLADRLGLSLDEIAAANIAKLQKRYPSGFSVDDSKNRKE